MTGLRGIWARWRAAALLLALVAVVFRAAVPAGYMLASDAPGEIAVMLCADRGAEMGVLDLATGEVRERGHQGDNTQASDHCPFAVAAMAAPPPQGPALAAPRFDAIASLRTARAERPAVTHTGPPLPARGPPLHA